MFPLMTRQYFDLWYRLDSEDGHLIWYTDDKDGVVVDTESNVPSFRNTEALLGYAQTHGLTIDVGEPILFNLDLAAQWLLAGTSTSVDCGNILNAWNLFDDVARSVGGAFDGESEASQKIYEKLFWGNNLPSVTPEGERYDPAWTLADLETLGDVLSSGLSLFRRSVGCA